MSSTNVVCAQFEIGDDSKGPARAAAFLLAQQYANANVLIASAVYTRESGTAFLVLVTAYGVTAGTHPSGGNTVFQAIEVEIEDAAKGLATFGSEVLAAAYAGLTYMVSFNVYRRESGIAFACAIMSN